MKALKTIVATDGHAGQASQDGGHMGSTAAAHGGDAHATSSTASTTSMSTHHVESGDDSSPHESGSEH
jgi:hypothetical protein